MVANAKAAVPTVGDNAVAMQLSTTAQNTAMALIELKNAAGKVSLLYTCISRIKKVQYHGVRG